MACSAYNFTASLNFTGKRFSKSFAVNPPSSVVFVRAPQPQKWNFLQCSSVISESNGFSGSKSSYTSGLKRSSQNSGFVRSASVEASGGLKRISENSIDHSDPSSKYRDLWVQCENEKCLGLNYKKDLMERLNICEHCGEHLKMSSSKRIELLIDPGTWEPMDEDMALDPIMFAFLSDSEEQLEGLFKMFEEGLEELTKLLEELFQEMSEERFELRELVLEGLDLEEEEALVGEAWSELAFSSLKKWWLELVLLALKEPEEEHLEEDLEKLGFVGSASDSAEGLVVLVIGGGGREHTLCSALQRSPSFDAVFCAPGNAGISNSGNATCISDLDISDSSAVISFCQTRGAGLVVVGPEAPLVAGFANDLVKAGIPTFGPSAEATVLEGSKDFMKKLCDKYGIPTAKYQTFTDPSAAKQYIKEQGVPIVIKTDGLAAGKGVVVAMTPEEAYEAVDSMLVKSAFGSAGCRVVIEEFLEGDEASFFFLVDGYDHCAYGFKE